MTQVQVGWTFVDHWDGSVKTLAEIKECPYPSHSPADPDGGCLDYFFDDVEPVYPNGLHFHELNGKWFSGPYKEEEDAVPADPPVKVEVWERGKFYITADSITRECVKVFEDGSALLANDVTYVYRVQIRRSDYVEVQNG